MLSHSSEAGGSEDTTPLSPDAPLWEWAFDSLSHRAETMLSHLDGVRIGEDIEAAVFGTKLVEIAAGDGGEIFLTVTRGNAVILNIGERAIFTQTFYRSRDVSSRGHVTRSVNTYRLSSPRASSSVALLSMWRATAARMSKGAAGFARAAAP